MKLLKQWLEALSCSHSDAPANDGDTPRTPEAALTSAGFTDLEPLGEGGMGKVVMACRGGKRHAIKMAIAVEDTDEMNVGVAVEGLNQKLLANKWRKNLNILDVEEVVTIGRYVFVVLEYADGGSLRERIGPSGYLKPGAKGPEGRALGATGDILPVIDAVAHIHERGWVHRDIKPENILFVEGAPKIADFGIVHRKAAGHEHTWGAGTPGYAAPKQIATEAKPDYRDDVYSLGVMLVEMLTGRLPKGKKTGASLPRNQPKDLAKIIKKATDPDKTKRYADARSLHMELHSLLDQDKAGR